MDSVFLFFFFFIFLISFITKQQFFIQVLLEQRGRKAIHDVVNKEMIECELDKNIKLAMVFDKRKDLQDKLGWFHGLRHTALRLFGLQVLDERADCEDVFALEFHKLRTDVDRRRARWTKTVSLPHGR